MSAAVLDPELKHLNLRDYLFTAEEQSDAEDILAILKPMKRATTFVCGEKQPTVSKILPTLAKLRIEMAVNEAVDSDLAKNMKEKIIENLDTRYKDNTVSSFLLKASFLDPRYKSLNNIAKEGAIFVTKQAIRDMCVWVAEKKASADSAAANTEKLPPFLLQQL